MSKKSFKGGFDSLLGETTENEKKTVTKKQKNQEEVRATFLIKENQLEKLRSIAHWDRLLIKNVLDHALDMYFEYYEKKNGEIKIRPEKNDD